MCSSTCGTPVLSMGVVRNCTLRRDNRSERKAQGGGTVTAVTACVTTPTAQPLSKTVSDTTQKILIHTLSFYSRHLRTETHFTFSFCFQDMVNKNKT